MNTARLDRARRAIADAGAGGLMLGSPANRFYLSGFTNALGAPYSSDIALLTRDTAALVVSPIHVGWASSEVEPEIAVHSAGQKWCEAVGARIRELDIKALLFEDDAIPYSVVSQLTTELGEGAELRPVEKALVALRGEKDGAELETISRATAITDEAFVAFSEVVRPGMTEREPAGIVQRLLLEQGGDKTAFDVIVASGPNAALPHHRPGNRELGEGEPIIIDMGCRLDGYCSDLTRTLFLGEPSEEFRDRYNVVLRAKDDAIAAIEPGRPAREVADIANAIIKEAGFGDWLAHGLGHGVGLNIHEWPSIRETSDDVLATGQVFSIEPGIYNPSWGGIRIEDVVVVTETGGRDLTAAPVYRFAS